MELAQHFMTLFGGFDNAFGTYKIDSTKTTGKVKGQAVTHRAPVTLSLWSDHLVGKRGIGIIPIRGDNTCVFGAIDIDIYSGLNFTEIIKKVRSNKFPFVPCRTKSGGCHLFVFIKEPVPATLLVSKLKEMAASLGYGQCEIFPKQTEVLTERGDIGQWINMPYFNGVKGLRYAINDQGFAIQADEFVKVAYEARITKEQLESIQVNTVSTELLDGPPCLSYLISQGFHEGMRNDGLFNIGVYTRKAFPDDWEHKLEEYNQQFMIPPLRSTEMMTIVKSLKKKTYMYKCQGPPINAFCNKALCITRKYGVGPEMSLPNLSNLTKYNSEPPVWFLNVENSGRLELATEDLQIQERFQRRCMEALNFLPPLVNRPAWQQVLQKLLEEVIVIEAPVDASSGGQLFEHLEKFCSGRSQARVKDEILLGKPFSENGHHIFRLSDFLDYLNRHKFNEFKVHKISSMIKDQLQAEHKQVLLKGKTINVWVIPAFKKPESEHDVPDFDNSYPM